MRRLVVVLLFLATATTASAKAVRVHTVGPRFDLGWVDSREHFAAKLDGMLATLPLRGRERDLVVLPEDLGLMSAFSGPRGAAARSSSTLVEAIAALTGSYGPQVAYYTQKFPSLAERGIPTRALALALTDTFANVAVETFSELADRYDVWLEAGVNMASDWERTSDPGKVAALGEPGRDYAYEATTAEPVNMALLFGPDGTLVSKQVKAYLTPIELPGQLDLVPGRPAGLDVVRTPVGRLGFVTSKDAWMPDVTGRLDDGRAQILVQPEFFVGDVVGGDPARPWAPDTLKASGYSDLLRMPSLRAMALPSMTGDIYDIAADAQSHIAVRAGAAGALVGQDPAPGLARVQPWPGPDPGPSGRAGIVDQRPEGTLSQDVDLSAPRYRRVKRRRDLPIAPSRRVQRHVVLSGRTAAWDQGGRVMTARLRHGRWSKPRVRGRGTHPSLSGRRLAYQRADGKVMVGRRVLGDGERPSVAGAFVAWVRDGALMGARIGDRPQRLDDTPPVELAKQLDNAWAPSVAVRGRRVLVSWVDFVNYKWDVFSRLSTDGGATFAPSVRVNDSPDANEALDDTPRATFAHGQPYVAWTDYRKRDTIAPSPLYDIYGARPGEPNAQLDGDGSRQVNAFAPAVTTLADGSPLVAFQSNRGATADIRLSDGRRVDDAGARAVNSWRPAITRLGRRRVLVAWEDDRDGPSNIFARVLVLPSAPSP